MKQIGMVASIMVLATVSACARFTIVSGSYWDYASKGTKQAILKIDTETGRTWRYVDSLMIVATDSGTHSVMNFGWEEVPDKSIATVNGVPVIPSTNALHRSR